jgi:cytochrome c oxidase cbb3-type subunit 1
MDSVALTIPYLKARSWGGAIMGMGHLIFAAHFIAMVLNYGPNRNQPALFPRVLGKKAAS